MSSVFRHRRGSVSLEFAMLAVPLLIMTLGVMEIAYDLYVQAALDNAVQTAARSVQVGATQTTGESSALLVQNAVCPNLHELLDCGQLIVGVLPVPPGHDYFTAPPPQGQLNPPYFTIPMAAASSANGAICTGSGGQMMLLQAWYIGPTFVGGLVPSFATTYNGTLQHITASSAGFVDESFPGGVPCPS
jgi:hypothetical protein